MDIDIKDLILEALTEQDDEDNQRQLFEFPSLTSAKDKKYIKALKDLMGSLNADNVNEDDIKLIRAISKHFSNVLSTVSMSRDERNALLTLFTNVKKHSISTRVPESIYGSYVFIMKYGKTKQPMADDESRTDDDYVFSKEDRQSLEKKLRAEIKKIKEDISFLEMEEGDRETIGKIINLAEAAIPSKEKTAEKIERKTRTPKEKAQFATTMISLLIILSRNVPYFFMKKFDEFTSDEQKVYNKINNKYIAAIKEYELDKEWDAVNDRIKNNDIISNPQGVEPDVKTFLNFAHLIFDHMDYEDVLEKPSNPPPSDETSMKFDLAYTFQGNPTKRSSIVGIKPKGEIKTLKDMRDRIHDIFFDVDDPTPSDQEQQVQPQVESIKRIIVNEFKRYLGNKR